MNLTQREILKLLRELLASASDIVEVAFTSGNHHITASLLLGDIEEDRIYLMSSALLSLCARIAVDLEQGSLDYVHFKGEYGYFIIMNVASEGQLIVMANKQAKLGLVFVEMARTSREILKVLRQPSPLVPVQPVLAAAE